MHQNACLCIQEISCSLREKPYDPTEPHHTDKKLFLVKTSGKGKQITSIINQTIMTVEEHLLKSRVFPLSSLGSQQVLTLLSEEAGYACGLQRLKHDVCCDGQILCVR